MNKSYVSDKNFKKKKLGDLDPRIQNLIRESGTTITNEEDLMALSRVSVTEIIQLFERISRGVDKKEALLLFTKKVVRAQRKNLREKKVRETKSELNIIKNKKLDLVLRDKLKTLTALQKEKRLEFRRLGNEYRETKNAEILGTRRELKKELENFSQMIEQNLKCNKILKILLKIEKEVKMTSNPRTLARLKKEIDKETGNFEREYNLFTLMVDDFKKYEEMASEGFQNHEFEEEEQKLLEEQKKLEKEMKVLEKEETHRKESKIASTFEQVNQKLLYTIESELKDLLKSKEFMENKLKEEEEDAELLKDGDDDADSANDLGLTVKMLNSDLLLLNEEIEKVKGCKKLLIEEHNNEIINLRKRNHAILQFEEQEDEEDDEKKEEKEGEQEKAATEGEEKGKQESISLEQLEKEREESKKRIEEIGEKVKDEIFQVKFIEKKRNQRKLVQKVLLDKYEQYNTFFTTALKKMKNDLKMREENLQRMNELPKEEKELRVDIMKREEFVVEKLKEKVEEIKTQKKKLRDDTIMYYEEQEEKQKELEEVMDEKLKVSNFVSGTLDIIKKIEEQAEREMEEEEDVQLLEDEQLVEENQEEEGENASKEKDIVEEKLEEEVLEEEFIEDEFDLNDELLPEELEMMKQEKEKEKEVEEKEIEKNEEKLEQILEGEIVEEIPEENVEEILDEEVISAPEGKIETEEQKTEIKEETKPQVIPKEQKNEITEGGEQQQEEEQKGEEEEQQREETKGEEEKEERGEEEVKEEISQPEEKEQTVEVKEENKEENAVEEENSTPSAVVEEDKKIEETGKEEFVEEGIETVKEEEKAEIKEEQSVVSAAPEEEKDQKIIRKSMSKDEMDELDLLDDIFGSPIVRPKDKKEQPKTSEEKKAEEVKEVKTTEEVKPEEEVPAKEVKTTEEGEEGEEEGEKAKSSMDSLFEEMNFSSFDMKFQNTKETESMLTSFLEDMTSDSKRSLKDRVTNAIDESSLKEEVKEKRKEEFGKLVLRLEEYDESIDEYDERIKALSSKKAELVAQTELFAKENEENNDNNSELPNDCELNPEQVKRSIENNQKMIKEYDDFIENLTTLKKNVKNLKETVVLISPVVEEKKFKKLDGNKEKNIKVVEKSELDLKIKLEKLEKREEVFLQKYQNFKEHEERFDEYQDLFDKKKKQLAESIEKISFQLVSNLNSLNQLGDSVTSEEIDKMEEKEKFLGQEISHKEKLTEKINLFSEKLKVVKALSFEIYCIDDQKIVEKLQDKFDAELEEFEEMMDEFEEMVIEMEETQKKKRSDSLFGDSKQKHDQMLIKKKMQELKELNKEYLIKEGTEGFSFIQEKLKLVVKKLLDLGMKQHEIPVPSYSDLNVDEVESPHVKLKIFQQILKKKRDDIDDVIKEGKRDLEGFSHAIDSQEVGDEIKVYIKKLKEKKEIMNELNQKVLMEFFMTNKDVEKLFKPPLLSDEEKLKKFEMLREKVNEIEENLQDSIDSQYKIIEEEKEELEEHVKRRVEEVLEREKKRYVVDVSTFENTGFLNKQFVVTKINKKNFFSKKSRLFEVDFMGGRIKNLSRSGKLKKTFDPSKIETIERDLQNLNILSLIFSHSKNPYTIICKNNEERERLFGLISGVKGLSYVWCNPLVKKGENSSLTTVRGKYRKPKGYKEKPRNPQRVILGQFDVKVTKDPFEKCKIWCSTWNMVKEKLTMLQFAESIPFDEDYHLYVICIQECSFEKIDFRDLLINHRGYTILECTQIGDTSLCLLIRTTLISRISSIQNTSTFFKKSKTNGSVGVGFKFNETKMFFVGSNFIKHKQEQNYLETILGLKDHGEYKFIDFFPQFDYVFWLGDFNFDIQGNDIMNIVKKEEKEAAMELFALDGLFKTKMEKNLLVDFHEPMIEFKPNYPVEPTTGMYVSLPAYRGRILYKINSSGSQKHFECQSYKAKIVQHQKMSYHQMTEAVFHVNTLLPYCPIYEKPGDAFYLEIVELMMNLTTSQRISKPCAFFYSHFMDQFQKSSIGKKNKPEWTADELPKFKINVWKKELVCESNILIVIRKGVKEVLEATIGTGVLSLRGAVENLNNDNPIAFRVHCFGKGKIIGFLEGKIKLSSRMDGEN